MNGDPTKDKQEIDPMSGLPVRKKVVDPFSGSEVVSAPGLGVPTSLQFNLNYRDRLEKYKKYGVAMSPYLDFEEERARRQPTSEKWKNGLMKMVPTMAGSFIENTVGVIDGVGEAIINWDSSKLYDNSVGGAVDTMNEWMADNFPNYYSQAEQNAKGLESLGYANFWADKVTNGLGYAGGAILSAIAIPAAGGGLATRGFAGASNALKSYTMGKGVATSTRIGKILGTTADQARRLNAVSRAETLIMMSYGEAAVEARQILNENVDRLTKERAAALGVNEFQMQDVEKQQIREEAVHAANIGFSLNLATLMLSNGIQFGNLFKTKYQKMRPSRDNIVWDEKLGKFVNKFAEREGWKQVIRDYGANPIRNGLTESFQEGTQFAIQDGAGRIADKGITSVWDHGALGQWTEALYEGAKETFDSKEGIDSLMLGFIVGGITGGGQAFAERLNRKSNNEQVQKALDAINNDGIRKAVGRAGDANEIAEMEVEQQEALRNGDHKLYRDLEFAKIFKHVDSAYRYGVMDQLEQMLDDSGKMDLEEYKKAMNVPDDVEFTEEDRLKIVSGLKDRITQFKEARSKLDVSFPNPVISKTDSSETKANKIAEIQELEALKGLILINAMKSEDVDSRIEQIAQEINEAAGNQNLTSKDFQEQQKVFQKPLTEEEIGAMDERELAARITDPYSVISDELAEKIGDSVSEATQNKPAEVVDLLQKADDLVRLTQDRARAAAALRELMGDPEKRSMYMERQKAADMEKAREKISTAAKNRASKATMSQEIQNILDTTQDQMTPEMRKELNEKRRKMNEEEYRLYNEYSKMTVPEVEKIREEEIKKGDKADPRKLAIIKHFLEEIAPQLSDPEYVRRLRKYNKSAAEKAVDEAIDEAVEDPIDKAIDDATDVDVDDLVSEEIEGLVRGFEEEAKKKEEREAKEKARREAERQRLAEEAEKADDTNSAEDFPEEELDTYEYSVRIQNGELVTAPSVNKDGSPGRYKPVLDNAGRLQPGLDLRIAGFAENGHRINRLISKENDLRGEKVTIKYIDGSVYNGKKVIGVYYGDELLGVLSETGAEKVAIPAVRELLEAKGELTGEIKTQMIAGKGNFTNKMDSNGNPILDYVSTQLASLKGFVGYGVVRRKEEGGMYMLSQDEELNAQIEAELDSRKGTNTFKDLTAGQVVAVIRLATGSHTIIPLSTDNVGKETAQDVIGLIFDTVDSNVDVASTMSTIRELVGYSRQTEEDTRFMIESAGGNILLSFERTVEHEGKPVTKIIRINAEELAILFGFKSPASAESSAKMRQDIDDLYMILEASEEKEQEEDVKKRIEDLEDKLKSLESGRDINFSIGEFEQVITKDGSTFINFKSKSKEFNYLYPAMTEGLKDYLLNFLSSRKKQVDRFAIEENDPGARVVSKFGENKVYNGYIDYIESEVLRTNIELMDGHPFYDVDLRILISGKAEESNTDAPIKTEEASTAVQDIVKGFEENTDSERARVINYRGIDYQVYPDGRIVNSKGNLMKPNTNYSKAIMKLYNEASAPEKVTPEAKPESTNTITGEEGDILDIDNGVEEATPSEEVLPERDRFFEDAARVFIEAGKATTSLLQQKLKLGYQRANKLIEELEAAGIVGKFDKERSDNNQGREVLVDTEALDKLLAKPETAADPYAKQTDAVTQFQEIAERSERIEKPTEQSNNQYVEGNERYDRATTVVEEETGYKRFDLRFDATKEDQERAEYYATVSPKIGDNIDGFIRKYLAIASSNEGQVSAEDELLLEAEFRISMAAKEDLIAAINSLQTWASNNGIALLIPGLDNAGKPIEISLASKDLGIAGTVDLIGIDSNGDFHIIDFKTIRNYSTAKLKQKAKFFIPQLATYAELMGRELKNGRKVAKVWVMPIAVTYPNEIEAQTSTFQGTDFINNPYPTSVKLALPGTVVDFTESVRSTEDPNILKLYRRIGFGTDTPLPGPAKLSRTEGFQKTDVEAARRWVTSRFGEDSFTVYDKLQMVGDAALHGYMHEAAVHMWRNAEVGTEYHESFHVFFRNLLTDGQRKALYREAEKRYTITSEDIANARLGQPEMSDAEARFLALEEKMADEFREYVIHQKTPKTLTQKLLKWFKDLFAYIKALATNRVRIDQAFRMIESNRIPAKLSRNATLMEGKAFMLKKFSFDPVLGKELIEFAASRVYEEARNGNLNAKYLLGTPPKYVDGKLIEGGKSKIRNWFLRHAFHVKTRDSAGNVVTRALTNEEFGNLLDMYTKDGVAGIKEYAASKNISSGIPQTDSNGTVMPQQIADSKPIAQVFFSIYNDWFDKPSKYSTTEQRGFRHEVIKILPLYGFNVRDYISVETSKAQSEQQEEDDIVEVAEEFKKIYSKSSMEENPASKLQQKALRALAGIEVKDTSSKTGLKRIANPMTVFTELSSAVHDARDFADMMAKLEKRKHNLDALNAVYDYLLGVDTRTQALIFASVSMASNEFISIIKDVEVDEKGNVKTIVKGYNPEASGFDTYYKRVWSEAAMAANGIYRVEYSSDGDVLSLQLRDENHPDLIQMLVGKIVSARKKNEGKLKNYSDEELIDIADLVWAMGLRVGDTKAATRERMLTYFKEVKMSPAIFLRNSRLTQAALNAFPVGADMYKNLFTDESTTIRYVATSVMQHFEPPKRATYIDASNKAKFTINQKSQLNIGRREVNDGEMAELFRGTLGHEAGPIKSLTLTLLENEEFQKAFKVADLAEITDESTFGRIINYKRMTWEDQLFLRLHQLSDPRSKDLSMVGLDLQGGRDRLIFGAFPKLQSTQSTRKYGLDRLFGNNTNYTSRVETIIRNSILLDLHRIYETDKRNVGFIKNYIDPEMMWSDDMSEEEKARYKKANRYRELQVGGYAAGNTANTLIEQAGFYIQALEAEETKEGQAKTMMSPELLNYLESKTKSILSKLEQSAADTVDKLGGAEAASKWLNDNLDSRTERNKDNPLEIIMRLHIHDFLGSMFTRDIYRGGVNFTKSAQDQYKRSESITTPGSSGFIRGTGTDTNSEWGMPEKVSIIVVQDIISSLTDEQLIAFGKQFAAAGVPEETILANMKAYAESVTTDGQTLISPIFHRARQQGDGLWEDSDEEVYQKFLKDGSWDGKTSPMYPSKPFGGGVKKHTRWNPTTEQYEETGIIETFVHKTSHATLTREFIQSLGDNPILHLMLDRMLGIGLFKGLGPVDIISVESANKLSSRRPVKFWTENADGTVELDPLGLADPAVVDFFPSKYLLTPQRMGEKKGTRVDLGTQIAVNQIANLENEHEYQLTQPNGEKITFTGQEIKDMYHKAFVAKMDQGFDRISKKFGFEDLLDNITGGSVEARNESLIKIVRYIDETALSRQVSQNLLDALALQADDSGRLNTALPLPFPSLTSMVTQTIVREFVNNVYRVNMPGVEMVQFANFALPLGGDVEKKSTLKFYEIEEGGRVMAAQVRMRADVLIKLGIKEEDLDDLDKVNEDLKKLVAYRIPQQGKSSVVVLELVGIMDQGHPSLIEVPGATVTPTGSDFDIDKLFVLFPDTKKDEAGNIIKAAIDYKALAASDNPKDEFTDAELNNAILDIFYSIGSDPIHFAETAAPLELTDIKRAMDDLGLSATEPDLLDLNSKMQSAVNFMSIAANVGIYANSVAARNVLEASKSEFQDRTYNVIIGGRTYSLNKIETKSPISNINTDSYISQHLGGSLDGIGDFIQDAINDNNYTAPLFSFMYSIGMTPELAVAMMVLPETRKKVEQARKNNDFNLTKVMRQVKPLPLDQEIVIDYDEMKRILQGEEDLQSREAYYLRVLSTLVADSERMGRAFTLARPDVGNIGTIQRHQAMLDLKRGLEQDTWGGQAAIKAITEGDAYPITASVYQKMNTTLDILSRIGLVANQTGVQKVKDEILKWRGDAISLTERTHRDINRQIVHHFATMPGSPLYEAGYLDEENIRRLFFGPVTIINEKQVHRPRIVELLERMQELSKARPNLFVNLLEVKTDWTMGSGKPFTFLQNNPRVEIRSEQKDPITNAWMDLIKNPGQYGEENTALVEEFTRAAITNSIIREGFAPSPAAYWSLTPIEAFVDPMLGDHFHEQMSKLDDENWLYEEFFPKFIENYAAHKYFGKHLFPVMHLKEDQNFLVQYARNPKETSRIKIVIKGKKKLIYQLSEDNKNYVLIRTKGQQNRLYESNIRGIDNEPLNTSLMKDRPADSGKTIEDVGNASMLDLGSEETYETTKSKIDRLRRNFAGAGINVNVFTMRLPDGVKGYQKGGNIYLDPLQLRSDTVYHEFAHILLEMMPEDALIKFIEEAENIAPELAHLVRNKYGEGTQANLTNPIDLGKELVATIVGMEGAKIDRKNPSKLRILVNKILRAIGKIFGIQPNKAAVLAEQMFAGDIRADLMTEPLNDRLNYSQTLHQEVVEGFNDVADSLERQLIALRRDPNTSDKVKLEVKTQQKSIRNMLTKLKEKQSIVEDFFKFAQLVHTRAFDIKLRMQEVIEKSDTVKTREEKLKQLQILQEIKVILDTMYDSNRERSVVDKIFRLLEDTPHEAIENERFVQAKVQLMQSLKDLESADEIYKKIGPALTVDYILTFDNTDINDRLEKEIARIRETEDLTGWRPTSVMTRDPEFARIKRKYGYTGAKPFTGPMPEGMKEELLEAKINWFKNRRLGRQELIRELTDAHTDKSWYSYMMDPLIYSRESNVQLLTMVVKDSIYKGMLEGRDVTFDVAEFLDRYLKATGKSEFNARELNKDLLTTTIVRDADGNNIEVLSIVQPYKVKEFKENRRDHFVDQAERFNKKYDRPLKGFWQQRAWDRDLINSAAVAEMRNEDVAWAKENSRKHPEAEKMLAEIDEKLNQLNVELLKATEAGDEAAQSVIKTERAQLLRRRDRAISVNIVTGEKVYMSFLAIPGEKYDNPQYKKITNDPTLNDYYQNILRVYWSLQKDIGKSQLYVNPWDEYSYIMPSFRDTNLGNLQGAGWRKVMKENLKDFTRLDTDVEFGMMTDQDGDRIRYLPRFGTNPVNHSDVSYDIAASLVQFAHMAKQYKHKSSIIGVVESMRAIHERREVLPVDKDGVPFLDLVARESRRAKDAYVQKSGPSNTYKHIEEFIDAVFYGRTDLSSGTILGVDTSKLAGKGASFTAIANLAGNILQVGNQFVLDNLMGAEESVAKQFFLKGSYRKAAGIYSSEGAAVADLGTFVGKSKLGQVGDMLDTMSQVGGSIMKKRSGSKAKNLLQNGLLMSMQEGIEHQTTHTRMIAMLLSMKPKDKDGNVIKKENGKDATMWDMFTMGKDGKVVFDERVDIELPYLASRLSGINRRANQIKGGADMAMATRRPVGKLALLFRNYLSPFLRKRFGHGDPYHMDYELGDITRGMYLSFGSFMKSWMEQGLGGYSKALTMMSETDRQNLRRMRYEGMVLASTFLILTLTGMLIDEDDDDPSYGVLFAAYQARRLQTELLQLVDPSESLRMLQSPMATLNWVEKYRDVIVGTAQLGAYYAGIPLIDESDVRYQRDTAYSKKGDLKVLRKWGKVIPLVNTMPMFPFTDTGGDVVEEKLSFFTRD